MLQVDFFSGIVLRALGIPVSMFTVLFAVARAVGWSCHWREMVGCSAQHSAIDNTLKFRDVWLLQLPACCNMWGC
jgi:Citrate synthase, C-terminal domain